MFMATLDEAHGKTGEEFSKPVEAIMRCEDFKSNFARRLSNRYTSRSSMSPKPDIALKLPPTEDIANVPERIEVYTQLSKSIKEPNGDASKEIDKAVDAGIRCTAVTALNMEVETLRWQLAQTEANRQMHIALLKQIVSFLNKVRNQIDNQKIDIPKKETTPTRISPRSFNVADLPRSRSVLHVNKNLEYLNPNKKISTKKISKSISNVNGYKECIGIWNQSKFSLISEKETAQKISEEISRLMTLANTVLSTKLPDLACNCTENGDGIINKSTEFNAIEKKMAKAVEVTPLLDLIEEDNNAFRINTVTVKSDTYGNIIKNSIPVENKDGFVNDFIVSQSPLPCGLADDFTGFELNQNECQSPLSEKAISQQDAGNILKASNKRDDYNHVSNFVEDESGFSSMSSFQEIGIPIISIIPPSPCKDMAYIDEIPDLLNEPEKWKADILGLDKQAVKVFWV